MGGAGYFSSAEKSIYGLGRKIGFALAFMLFASALYFILSRLNKLPEHAVYWHFAGAAIILSVLILVVKSFKNE